MSDVASVENTEEPLLSVSNLRVEYPGAGRKVVRAVRGVDFAVERGKVLGLVGESGSGKSSAARAVVQLEDYTGTVNVDGVDLAKLSSRELRKSRSNFQIVFQDSMAAMDPRRTTRELLERPLKIHRIGTPESRRARAEELLQLVGLDPAFLDRYPVTLSGGQRQRVNIARALALNPTLLVCDEPVSALDVSIQAQILTLLGELREKLNLTILFISHDLAVVRHFCDDVAVMNHGVIVEHGSVEDVLFNPQHPYTKKLLAAAIDVIDPSA